jgi:hypothetical protein
MFLSRKPRVGGNGRRRTSRTELVLEICTKIDVAVRELERRRKDLTREMATLRPVPRLAPIVVENRLAEWRRLLRQSVTQGRTVLQRVLHGRITFTPRRNPISDDVNGYEFECPTRFDGLFTGIAVQRPKSLAVRCRLRAGLLSSPFSRSCRGGSPWHIFLNGIR